MQILEYTLLQSETVGFASQNSLSYHAKQCLLQDTDKEAITQNNTLLKIFTAHFLPNNLCAGCVSPLGVIHFKKTE